MNETEARIIMVCKRGRTLDQLQMVLDFMKHKYTYWYLCRVSNKLVNERCLRKSKMKRYVYYIATKNGVDIATDFLVNNIDERRKMIQNVMTTTIKDYVSV